MGTVSDRILESVKNFSPITLEEMDDVRLMNRTDTKYIFPTTALPDILNSASGLYRILSIDEKRIFETSIVFTPDKTSLKSDSRTKSSVLTVSVSRSSKYLIFKE